MNYAEDLENRLIRFGLLVVTIAEALPKTDFGMQLCGQLSRSAPSAAQNYGEARSAESRRDFVHKMKICLKELRETFVSLKSAKQYLDIRSEAIPGTDDALQENNELVSIFVKSVQTAGRKR